MCELLDGMKFAACDSLQQSIKKTRENIVESIFCDLFLYPFIFRFGQLRFSYNWIYFLVFFLLCFSYRSIWNKQLNSLYFFVHQWQIERFQAWETISRWIFSFFFCVYFKYNRFLLLLFSSFRRESREASVKNLLFFNLTLNQSKRCDEM